MKNFARQISVVGIGAALFFQSLTVHATNSRVKEIVVVFKTHFDIGYTELVTNVLNRYPLPWQASCLKHNEK